MKKYIFFLTIPLILSSWTGTWDKGYVVEEKVDTFAWMYYTTSTGNEIFRMRRVNSNEYWVRLDATNETVIFKLPVQECDSVYLDSVKFIMHTLYSPSNAETLWVNLEKVKWIASISPILTEKRDTIIGGFPSGTLFTFVIEKGFSRLRLRQYFITIGLKKRKSGAYYLNWGIAYYKAYYKVR